MSKVSPVIGFLDLNPPRFFVLNVPKPVILTFSPSDKACDILNSNNIKSEILIGIVEKISEGINKCS